MKKAYVILMSLFIIQLALVAGYTDHDNTDKKRHWLNIEQGAQYTQIFHTYYDGLNKVENITILTNGSRACTLNLSLEYNDEIVTQKQYIGVQKQEEPHTQEIHLELKPIKSGGEKFTIVIQEASEWNNLEGIQKNRTDCWVATTREGDPEIGTDMSKEEFKLYEHQLIFSTKTTKKNSISKFLNGKNKFTETKAYIQNKQSAEGALIMYLFWMLLAFVIYLTKNKKVIIAGLLLALCVNIIDIFDVSYLNTANGSLLFGLIMMLLLFNKKEWKNAIVEYIQENKQKNKKIRAESTNPFLKRLELWIEKEGRAVCMCLIIIVLIALGLRIFDLGGYDFYNDEFQVIASAVGYQYVGEFAQWDWIRDETVKPYDRAWPHTWMISLIFETFGVSEVTARALSFIFGMILIVASYFIARFFLENRYAALLTTAFIALSPHFIRLSRYTRMYVILVTLFFIAAYLLYRGVTEKGRIKNEWFACRWSFIISGLAITALCATMHMNALTILPVIYLFCVYKAWKTKEKKYQCIVYLGILVLLCAFASGFLEQFKFFKYFSWFARNNLIYLELLFRNPIGPLMSLVFFIVFLKMVPLIPKSSQKLKDKMIFLAIAILFALVWYIYIGDRYPSTYYINHFIPFVIMAITITICLFIKTCEHTQIKKAVTVLLVLAAIMPLAVKIDDLYLQNTYGQNSIAYQTIIENYDPETEVLFGQYLRTFYLEPLDEARVIDMKEGKMYRYDTFLEDIVIHKRGWITWATRKNSHVHPTIRGYVCQNFQQVHGESCGTVIDNTRVEVFYFNESMIKIVKEDTQNTQFS